MTTTIKRKLMTRTILLGVVAAALLAPAVARAQKKLQVALYAPSAAFESSQARFVYVQGLAKAIENKTGLPTEGKAYVKLSDMQKAKPDFAVVDGPCLAAKSMGELLAVASVDGRTSLKWALFGRAGGGLLGLKAKKLAVATTGCRDDDLIQNAMLQSEVSVKYFGGLVSRNDVQGAVAAVKDFKQADAVFAPVDAGAGLTKLFDAASVPTPGFVQVNKALPAAVAASVKAAVLGYGAGGGIDGWKAPQEGAYAGLAADLRPRVKRPVFARPDAVRLDGEDVVAVPKSSFDQATVSQHFWEPK